MYLASGYGNGLRHEYIQDQANILGYGYDYDIGYGTGYETFGYGFYANYGTPCGDGYGDGNETYPYDVKITEDENETIGDINE